MRGAVYVILLVVCVIVATSCVWLSPALRGQSQPAPETKPAPPSAEQPTQPPARQPDAQPEASQANPQQPAREGEMRTQAAPKVRTVPSAQLHRHPRPQPTPPTTRPPHRPGHWHHWHSGHHAWVYLPQGQVRTLVLPSSFVLPNRVEVYDAPDVGGACVCPHCHRPVQLIPG